RHRSPLFPYTTLFRSELMEETGLAVAPQRVRRTIHHAYPDRLVELVVIDCEASSKAAQPLGSAEVRWVSPAELSNYDFPAANQRSEEHTSELQSRENL